MENSIDCEQIIEKYELIGVYKGRRYRFHTRDLDSAIRMMEQRSLSSIWKIENDGERKLIRRNKDE